MSPESIRQAASRGVIDPGDLESLFRFWLAGIPLTEIVNFLGFATVKDRRDLVVEPKHKLRIIDGDG